MALSARPRAPVSSDVSCWLIRSMFIAFLDSSTTIMNASNLFSRCIGGGRIPVFAILVIAASGVEDATAAIQDKPLGFAHCQCHQLFC